MNEPLLRKQMAAFSALLWERGWVANHDGNLSLRLERARLLCTPTGVSKREVRPDALLIVDESGRVLSGSLRPFSELSLHLAWYQARPDVRAVLHAHPPTATGFGVAGVSLDRPFLAEAVVSLGPGVPTVPLCAPGTEAVQGAAPYFDEHDALLLAGNGVLTCGVDLEQAFLRMELTEHLAKIALVAHQLGGVNELPAHQLQPLLQARARAGLGPEARGKQAATTPGSEAVKPAAGELEKIIREEIRRVLK